MIHGEMSTGPDLAGSMKSRLPRMLDEIAAMVDLESPSNDQASLAVCCAYVEALGTSLLGFAPERITPGDGLTHLLWQFGDAPRVALVGHYDTVHPVGTVRNFPFSVDGDIARGPGVCDMKAGVVMGMHAIAEVRDRMGSDFLDGVCLLVNADEEVGSPSSLPTIDLLAGSVECALVFEAAGRAGEVKTARRGVSRYEVRAHGRAAHAGAEPERGINALEEICRQIPGVVALADPAKGTSVIPTMASAGTTYNSIPELASINLDVRCNEVGEQHRIHDALHALKPVVEGASLEILGGAQAAPMPPHLSAELYEVASAVWSNLGFGPLPDQLAGGTSDANRIASFGVPVIDGLGPIGGDDHSDREWVEIPSIHERSALAAGMLLRLLDPGHRLRKSTPAARKVS